MAIKFGIYRHYKGKDYLVYGQAVLSGTEDGDRKNFIEYLPLWGDMLPTIRPLDEFLGAVQVDEQKVARFQLVREIPEKEAILTLLMYRSRVLPDS